MNLPIRFERSFPARQVGLPRLDTLARLGALTVADVHTATRLAALCGDDDERVMLAAALTVRALRQGSVSLDLAGVAEDVRAGLLTAESDTDTDPDDAPPAPDGETPETTLAALDWPEPAAWAQAVQESRMAAQGVLVVEFDRVLLGRYRALEARLAEALAHRAAQPPPLDADGDNDALESSLDRLFGPRDLDQREACRVAATSWTSVVTGGPGTGKTHTVARLLAVLAEQAERAGAPPPRVALAAPTGRAAAGLQASVRAASQDLGDADVARIGTPPGSTLHRLLGTVPGRSTTFRHHRSHPLPHDVVVVDEASMVPLALMASLVDAVRPDTRLVLVGDADQLASVEAGAVLADLVEGWRDAAPSPIGRLGRSRRFGEEIGALASAVLEGRDHDAMDLLTSAADQEAVIRLVSPQDPEQAADLLRPALLGQAVAVRDAALEGDAASALRLLGTERLLCVHRRGEDGVTGWNRRIRGWVEEATGQPAWAWRGHAPGRPLLITRNDRRLGLHNGDIGVVVLVEGRPMAAFGDPADPLLLPPGRLDDVEDLYAMTVHKAQGGQADRVHVLLPAPAPSGLASPLLTRQLLYTALTRARRQIVVVGSVDAVRHAVRQPARRASTLRERLGKEAAGH